MGLVSPRSANLASGLRGALEHARQPGRGDANVVVALADDAEAARPRLEYQPVEKPWVPAPQHRHQAGLGVAVGGDPDLPGDVLLDRPAGTLLGGVYDPDGADVL